MSGVAGCVMLEDVVYCCGASEASEDEGNGGDLLSIISIRSVFLVHMFVIPSSRHRFCKSGFLRFLSRKSLVGNSREGSGGSCGICSTGVEELSTAMFMLSVISDAGDSVFQSDTL